MEVLFKVGQIRMAEMLDVSGLEPRGAKSKKDSPTVVRGRLISQSTHTLRSLNLNENTDRTLLYDAFKKQQWAVHQQ